MSLLTFITIYYIIHGKIAEKGKIYPLLLFRYSFTDFVIYPFGDGKVRMSRSQFQYCGTPDKKSVRPEDVKKKTEVG